jgi:hypothetical protein
MPDQIVESNAGKTDVEINLSEVKEKKSIFHKEIYTIEEVSLSIFGNPVPIRNTALIVMIFVAAALAYNVGRMEQLEQEKMIAYNCGGIYNPITGTKHLCRLELNAASEVIFNCTDVKQNDFKSTLLNSSYGS